MRHLDLLNAPLKSQFLCDLFETYDVVVSYEYDRTHENMPDEYHAEIPDLGLQFIFDGKQKLRTLFIRPVAVESYDPLGPLAASVELFPLKTDAASHAAAKAIPTTAGQSDFMGEDRDWIRFEYPEHSIHYEFIDSELGLITLQTNGGQ